MIWFWTPGTPSPTCCMCCLLDGERPTGALSYTYRLELCIHTGTAGTASGAQYCTASGFCFITYRYGVWAKTHARRADHIGRLGAPLQTREGDRGLVYVQ